MLIQTVLAKKYKLIAVSDAFQGMHILKARREAIDLVIVDVDYQPQENWDFIHHIKTSQVYQRPVIVLLSDRSELTTEMLLNTQVNECFFKPFNPLDLVSSVNTLLNAASLKAYINS